MKIYRTLKVGNLMAVRAYVKGPEGEARPKLLVDTGSTYTVIAQEILELIGCPPVLWNKRRRVSTASGIEMLPVVEANLFHCLGQLTENMTILAHTLPFGTYVDGLVGMDFLARFFFDIRPSKNQIIFHNE